MAHAVSPGPKLPVRPEVLFPGWYVLEVPGGLEVTDSGSLAASYLVSGTRRRRASAPLASPSRDVLITARCSNSWVPMSPQLTQR